MAFDTQAHPLDAGAKFPSLEWRTTAGSTIALPTMDDQWSAVLIYRGEW